MHCAAVPVVECLGTLCLQNAEINSYCEIEGLRFLKLFW
jgi:hypothetical protein